ncbi:MAG: AraC family transcriptional regulator [Bordetella sp.]|nr:AraC family transcriptional regulator [Pseudomonadota bacterium]
MRRATCAPWGNLWTGLPARLQNPRGLSNSRVLLPSDMETHSAPGPFPHDEATGAAAERVIVRRQRLACGDLSAQLVTEDVSAPTDWSFAEEGHTLVVHLAGRLSRMESVFSAGPSSDLLPQVGDIWTIPAGCRYAAMAQGATVRFAEFRVPAELLGGGEMAARVGHRDAFLHHASARVLRLAQRDDDLGRMALQSLLAAIRLHIADAYLRSRPDATPARRANRAHRFSDRQRQRLAQYIAASMHETIRVEALAQVAGVSVAHLMEGFKASFGTTPWQHVLRTRVAEARRLLEATDLSITAIAVAVGFSSPSHFASAFGRHVGASPGAYRRERRAG